MKDLAAEISADAKTLTELYQRIKTTYANRGRDWSDWEKACREYHSKYRLLFFPGGEQRWQAFINRDPSEIDTAITYLEVDPVLHRSGYIKQSIWNRLKSSVLSSQQKQRIEELALTCLNNPIRAEFWYMGRYLRVRGSDELWNSINSLSKQQTDSATLKAHWLVLMRKNLPAQRLISNEYLRARYKVGYVPDLTLSQIK